MNPRFLIISALAVSFFATQLPVFATAKSSQIESMSEEQRDELLAAEIYKRIDGGMNSGGGNSINGKVIESYRADYKKLKGHKEVVNPVLKKLSVKIPALAQNLRKISDEKIWFYVPAEFSTIPREISGIPAYSEQTAINKKHIVWVSSPNLEAKGADQAGILLVHEMVMSYLMKESSTPLSMSDLIGKTQVMTSLLLDIDSFSSTELKERIQQVFVISEYTDKELAMDAEIQRLGKSVKNEQAVLCTRYDLLNILNKSDSYTPLTPSEYQQLHAAFRALTLAELKVLYPLFGNTQQVGLRLLTYAQVAQRNNIYRTDLEGIKLSQKYSNKELAEFLAANFPSEKSLPVKMSQSVCFDSCNEGTYSGFIPTFEKICGSDFKDKYGW